MQIITIADEAIYNCEFNLPFEERIPWSEEQVLEILIKKPKYDSKILKSLIFSAITLVGFALEVQAKYREVKGSKFFERPTKVPENFRSTVNDGYFKIFFASNSFIQLVYSILSDERMVKLAESNANLALEIKELREIIKNETTFTKLLVTTAFFGRPLARIAHSGAKKTRDFVANLLKKKNQFFRSEENFTTNVTNNPNDGAFNFYENSFKSVIEETPYATLGLVVLKSFFPNFFQAIINPDEMEIAKALGKKIKKGSKKRVVPFYIKVLAFIIAFPFDHPYLLSLVVLLFFFRKAICSIVFTHFSFFSKQNDELSKLFNYSENNPAKLVEEEKSPAAVAENKAGEFSEKKEDSTFYTSVKSAYYNFNKPTQQDNHKDADDYDYDDF